MPRADNVAALEFYSGVIIYFEPRISLPQLKKNWKCEHFWRKKAFLKEKSKCLALIEFRIVLIWQQVKL
jgi:hypothetical protein